MCGEIDVNEFMDCIYLFVWIGGQAFTPIVMLGVLSACYAAYGIDPGESRSLKKFDYNRPIPESMIPKPKIIAADPFTDEDSISAPALVPSDVNSEDDDMLIRGAGDNNLCLPCKRGPTLDCIICFNEIDLRDRSGYMLASCDHVYHKHCLEKWMDIKMECPTCRGILAPAL
uniref:RING-type domain-containing protein n=1 Tax=Chaetoceros debilis TaxID=122233 RepID=A0A7S3QJT7_9STRA|mmetsp:Transcript_29042/g.44316  ORF Transcript_29042/g.44316 Transcript_29042/m.44316 type:complete len:172 (+) Transcript_29042:31-546(+)